jgi:GT2 family glycosyltransferase
VVCVHNALDETRVCLDAVAAATKGQYFLTVVDDGSEVETNAYIQDFVAQAPNRRLLVNSTNQGYTKSANRGLRAARADWVILLNSDTIVTENWLAGLLDCALSDPAIRAVGPLSNAATFQSMPWTVGDGDGARPDQDAVQRIARRLSELSWSACPKVPMLNGFCLMLHKPTLGEIGYLDETNFPIGYGEENDLCLRMVIAGHVLAIADYVYVYHSRSASFGTKRKLLAENAFKTLRRLWPGYNYTSITQSIQDIPALAHLREAIW